MLHSLLRWICLVLILYFFAVGVAGLDRFPGIHEDESWIAAPGYTFWEKGYFGADLFAGFYGMEKHYYEFPPVFSIMVGAGLHLFGLGLFQARFVSLLLMTLTLSLTFHLGERLFSPWHGLLAVFILLSWQIATSTIHLATGIPMMDMARLVRYDDAVPFFGLSAFALTLIALKNPRFYGYVLAGFLIGLSALSHFYGVFWFPALLLVLAIKLKSKMIQPALAMGMGVGMILLPWLIYVASGWDDFVNQSRQNMGYFNIFNPQFYLQNLSMERDRYLFVLDMIRHNIGATLGAALFITGCVWLLWQALLTRKIPAQMLSVVFCVMCGLLALLIRKKDYRYLMTMWPLFALVAAAGTAALWKLARPYYVNWILAVLLLGAGLEGVISALHMQAIAGQTTPYRTYTSEIAYYLPPGSHVLGLQHYWLGLALYSADYRSILVPINQTNSLFVAEPISFAEAAQVIPPDVILIDQIMQDFLNEAAKPRSEWHTLGRQIQQYLSDRNAQLIGKVDDSTYGQCLIYQLEANVTPNAGSR
jgi:4-amino-4-deoxy-L-arabinose transferase-like glycosyltransferase